MFIQTEATPNPATLKFLPGKVVLEKGTAEFRDETEAAASPLAARLFGSSWRHRCLFGYDFITVTKDGADWQHLKPAILGNDHGALHVRSAGHGRRRKHGRMPSTKASSTTRATRRSSQRSRNCWTLASALLLPRTVATSPSRASRTVLYT
jgi:hypothetical protein